MKAWVERPQGCSIQVPKCVEGCKKRDMNLPSAMDFENGRLFLKADWFFSVLLSQAARRCMKRQLAAWHTANSASATCLVVRSPAQRAIRSQSITPARTGETRDSNLPAGGPGGGPAHPSPPQRGALTTAHGEQLDGDGDGGGGHGARAIRVGVDDGARQGHARPHPGLHLLRPRPDVLPALHAAGAVGASPGFAAVILQPPHQVVELALASAARGPGRPVLRGLGHQHRLVPRLQRRDRGLVAGGRCRGGGEGRVCHGGDACAIGDETR